MVVVKWLWMVHHIYMYYYGMKMPHMQMNSNVQQSKDEKKVQNGLLKYFDNIINQNTFNCDQIFFKKIDEYMDQQDIQYSSMYNKTS